MTRHEVHLISPVSRTFRCLKAANSLDINVDEKSRHDFSVDCDLDSPYSVGVIVGSSGSGKTTLAEQVWGKEALRPVLDPNLPVLDQFPQTMSYERSAQLLTGVGLSSVPCWIRTAYTLSNGQQARAEIALRLALGTDPLIVDEWTSVVDRIVARVMSHAVQKFVRTHQRRIVLLTCHRDILDWVNPDWIVDCDKQTWLDRRALCPGFKRKEKIKFEIRECDKRSWSCFARYHYLSERLPAFMPFTFGLFHNDNQIGFHCFANYTPYKKHSARRMILHSNRIVIHPDYVGFGLGMRMVNATSDIVARRGYTVMAKFSSLPMLRSRLNDPLWRHDATHRHMKLLASGNIIRKTGYRQKVTAFVFTYIGPGSHVGRI